MKKDKILHFLVCAVVAMVVSVVFALMAGVLVALMAGGLSALMLGVGKEYGDKCAKGNYWSWGDLLADGVGAIAGCAIAWLVIWLFMG